MKAVRFKPEYSDSEPRLSYELESEKLYSFWDRHSHQYKGHYHVKLLGLVPAYKMEEADVNDRPAIEPFVILSNLQNG